VDFVNYVTTNNVAALAVGQVHYTTILNERGTIEDDALVYRFADRIMMVVNASNAAKDLAHIARHAKKFGVTLRDASDEMALLAVQGPNAARVLQTLTRTDLGPIQYYHFTEGEVAGHPAIISRTGYTGEDGFELYVENEHAVPIWNAIMKTGQVSPAGLGARDSLRLEAGLCLYGHDIDETTSPVEADLVWSIQKRRRSEGGFPGAKRIQDELANGPRRRRVGIKPDGRAPAREGTEVLALLGDPLGIITSGGFGPSVNGPVAMGYVASDRSAIGTPVNLMVRGKALSAAVARLPFVAHRYARKT
jgi:aminomethyltransferase